MCFSVRLCVKRRNLSWCMKQQSQFSHRFSPNSPSLVRCPQHRHSDPQGSSCCGQQPRYSRNAGLQERAPNSSHCRELRGHLDPTQTWNKPFFGWDFSGDRTQDVPPAAGDAPRVGSRGEEEKKKSCGPSGSWSYVAADHSAGGGTSPPSCPSLGCSLARHGTPRTRLFCKIKSF